MQLSHQILLQVQAAFILTGELASFQHVRQCLSSLDRALNSLFGTFCSKASRVCEADGRVAIICVAVVDRLRYCEDT